jgi:hypothetical protein
MWSSEKTEIEVMGALSLRQHAFRLLLTTQVIFFVSIFWCMLLVHDFAAQSAGISFYGVTSRTIVIAIVGYVAAAIGLWRTSLLFRQGGAHILVWVGLRAVAAMLILLLLTPYDAGTFYNWAHMTVGVAGALIQLALSITLLRNYGSRASYVGFSIQLIGGILAAFSMPDWRFQILLYAETIFELGFAWCLLEWTRALNEGSELSVEALL